jgi:hypothetical protein
MIYSDSRYATGTIFTARDSRNGLNRTTVYRQFPTEQITFYQYTWVEGDRIDFVASELLGGSQFWWRIMDFNPEIIDPFEIPIGTTVRIPVA